MLSIRSLFLGVFLFVITWSGTNIDKKQIITGGNYLPEHLSPPRVSQKVVTPYSLDTSNILSALREYKLIYFSSTLLHGAYLVMRK